MTHGLGNLEQREALWVLIRFRACAVMEGRERESERGLGEDTVRNDEICKATAELHFSGLYMSELL